MNTQATATTSNRAGMTLLEVLIASGILVVGLSSVAAILPAAGSLLGEASMIDRATTLAANAAADLEFQRTLLASDFNAIQGPTHPTAYTAANGERVTAVVMGAVFAAPAIDLFYRTTFRRRLPPNTQSAADTSAYGSTWYIMTATPAAPLPPPVKPLSPLLDPIPAANKYTAGMPVRVTVAVTRRPLTAVNSDTAGVLLARVSEGVYRVVVSGTNPNPPLYTLTQRFQLEATRKAYLSPCSWVLVSSPGGVPTWLRIGSSWATYDLGVGGQAGEVARSFVSFTDPAAATAAETSGGFSARCFAGVVRIQEFILPLN